MNNTIETLFTQALGLQAPQVVHEVKLDTAVRRIDFEIVCQAQRLLGLPSLQCRAPARA